MHFVATRQTNTQLEAVRKRIFLFVLLPSQSFSRVAVINAAAFIIANVGSPVRQLLAFAGAFAFLLDI